MIQWLPFHTNPLQTVQTALNSKPFIRLPDLSKYLYLFWDALSIAVSACMAQLHHGEYLSARYMSRKFTLAEQRSAIQDREAVPICWTVHKLSRYLLGRHFFTFTYHKGLSVLASGNMHQVYRWALLLQQYSYTLLQIPASQNRLSDRLSRHPSYTQ